MISGLCESPLTFQAITIWRDELLNEDILLRDVIDLEATFGNQLGEDDEPVIDTANVTAEKAAVKNNEPELDADGNRLFTTTMMTRMMNIQICLWLLWRLPLNLKL